MNLKIFNPFNNTRVITRSKVYIDGKYKNIRHIYDIPAGLFVDVEIPGNPDKVIVIKNYILFVVRYTYKLNSLNPVTNIRYEILNG